jgi:hypothetical protein
MPPERQAAPAAFEANNIIVVKRSPDRNAGRPLTLGLGCRFSEPDARLMNGRYQRRELVGGDFVLTKVRADNRRREFSIDRCEWWSVGHFVSPCPDRQNTMPRKKRNDELGSPSSITPPAYLLLVLRVQKRPPAEFS